VVIDSHQEFLVQPVDASWLQCNIECQEACPVGTNCRGYLNLAAEGRFEEGYILSREPNPVAAMCAYVCSAPCERACRRGDIDRPLAIRAMKRFLVEWHAQSGIPDEAPLITPRDTTVAVVGAGPAGLSVARELAVAGHRVTVFDELPMAGGTMLVGVPAFRLPRRAIEMDVELIEQLGVTFRYDTRIGRDITFEQLQGDFDAVAICAGAMDPVPLDVPGNDLEGIQYGVEFMRRANLGEPLEVGQDVVIIGGGYTAMDCSRTSLRHGASNVTIAYRRTRSELVVDEEELGETEREGVTMDFLVSPVEIIGDEQGRVAGVRFVRNRLGEPDATGRRRPVPIEGAEFVVPAQTVIPAVSQAADNTFLPVEAKFEINRGRMRVDPGTYATNVRGVFACGDFVTGPTTLIEAAGHGKKCAYAIDRYLSGRSTVDVETNVRVVSSWRHEMPERYDVLPRQHIPMLQADQRMPSHATVNFNTPVELGYTTDQAVAESTRCLMCNYNIWFDGFRCVLCGACADVCPEGVIHMIDINQMKSEGALPELVDAYGWSQGGAMVLDEERCIRCALCVKRCPYDAITMERFELQEISEDGRLYKESYRDTQLGLAGVGNQAEAGGR
jgi:NADPH-dependent glutamate synthase beta subunit-like oxidoreductase/ferredoxin